MYIHYIHIKTIDTCMTNVWKALNAQHSALVGMFVSSNTCIYVILYLLMLARCPTWPSNAFDIYIYIYIYIKLYVIQLYVLA